MERLTCRTLGALLLAPLLAPAALADECRLVQVPGTTIAVSTCYVRVIEVLGPSEGMQTPVPQIKIESDGGPDREIHFDSYAEAKQAFDELMDNLQPR